MRTLCRRRFTAAVIISVLPVSITCNKNPGPHADHPRLSPNVVLQDVTFNSRALGRPMLYRVALPTTVPPHQELSVVYLLHGSAGDFRDWTNFSDVTQYIKTAMILAMPQGDESYYVNAAGRPGDRYEDYIVQDLISDLESKFPAARDRTNRAIVGISMGGFGAIKIALSHPELFVFAGGLSSAIDVPRRQFSFKRIQQYQAHSIIFGPWGSDSRRRNDPFVIAKSVNPAAVPYLYLSCGGQDAFLPANRDFVALLTAQHIEHEFRIDPGGHDWAYWNTQLPGIFERLLVHLGRKT
jgi:putative tributyrin esterase